MPEGRPVIVETHKVEYFCDLCGAGKVQYTGVTLTSHPPWYVHRCAECSHEMNLRSSYPKLVYKEREISDVDK